LPKATIIKEEELSDAEVDELQVLARDVVSVLDNVWALQDSISPTFKDGRTLDSLIQALQSFKVNPTTSDFFILNGAMAIIRVRKGHRVKRYFTLDHRRLCSLHRAGFTTVRSRIQPDLIGRRFHEFVNKAHVGRKLAILVPSWRLLGATCCQIGFNLIHFPHLAAAFR
jgi:hypothetical protein